MRIKWSLASWRIFLVVQLSVFPIARCFFDSHEFEQRTIALFRVIRYLIQRPQQMNVDGLFGMTLAEANLLAILYHPNVQFLVPHYRDHVSKILQLLHRARVHIRRNVHSESHEVALINAVLNEPSLWIKPIFWQQGALGRRPKSTPGLNETIAEELIYQGSPQEKESDLCIGELIVLDELRGCKVSDGCAEMLLKRDSPAGYPLTHRLLYVQIARALNCRENRRVKFVTIIPAYCREILQNLVDMETTEFPGVSRDLAIEQVLLCGMEGFLDFANDHYAKLIRSWAHPFGCYNSRGFHDLRDNLTNSIPKGARRSTETMDFGCENHASGLAAGSLALFVRESVENAFNSMFDYQM